jgi:XTP/dITP diphosphohydrolase
VAPSADARLVVATGNPGKLREIRAMLGDLPVKLLGLRDLPDVVMPEEGDDYRSNAILKARHVAGASGCVAVADDSGLEVDGLGGRPGPHSARYGGPGLDDAGRVRHLLAELAGMQGEQRNARFVCWAAVARPSGEVETALGICSGRILLAPVGDGGFGYDPVFFSNGEQRAMATVPEARKNEISHRALAFRALRGPIEAAVA